MRLSGRVPTDGSSHLRIRLRSTGSNRLSLALSDDLDLATISQIEAVGQLVRSLAVTSLNLDLAGIDFVDLAGGRALDGLRLSLEADGTFVELAAASLPVQRLAALRQRLSRPT